MLFDLGLISMDWAFFVIDLQSNGAEAASLKGFCFRVEGLRFFFFWGGVGACWSLHGVFFYIHPGEDLPIAEFCPAQTDVKAKALHETPKSIVNVN